MDFSYLLSFVLLLFFFLWRYTLKKKTYDAGSVLISLYIIYAVFAVLLYFDKNSVDSFVFQNFGIKPLPLLYLFITLAISFSPILLYDSRKYNGIQPPSVNLDYFAWFFILCFLLQIGGIFENLSNGLYQVLFVDDGTAELYSQMIDKTSEGGKGISNIFSIFANTLYGFGIIMFFYYISQPKRKKLIVWGLGIGILIGILSYAAAGQRGGMIKRTLLFLGTFFLIRNYLGDKVKKWIAVSGAILVLFLTFIFATMTVSRFGERDGGASSSIVRYAGQAVLNFDRYAFDNNGIRYGDRVFPIFKKLLLFENVPDNFIERRAKYPYLYINDEVFVTYIGDFCFDFGPYVAFILIVLFSIWVRSRTKSNNSQYPFHKLILLQFCLSICIQGGSLFSYADTGNLTIIVYLLLYTLFAINYSNRSNTVIC